MKDKSVKADRFDTSMVMNNQEIDRIGVGGVFTVQCFDAGGQLKWEESFHNLVTKQGLQNMNDVYLRNQTQTGTWYLGLVDNGSFSAFSNNDTNSSHTGWIEFTSYSAWTSRPSLAFSAATNADPSVIATSSASSFSINGTGTVKGAFVTSLQTGTSGGVLFSEGAFSATRNVVSGDTLNVNYSLSNDGV